MPTTEPSVTDRAGWVAAYLRRLELTEWERASSGSCAACAAFLPQDRDGGAIWSVSVTYLPMLDSVELCPTCDREMLARYGAVLAEEIGRR